MPDPDQITQDVVEVFERHFPGFKAAEMRAVLGVANVIVQMYGSVLAAVSFYGGQETFDKVSVMLAEKFGNAFAETLLGYKTRKCEKCKYYEECLKEAAEIEKGCHNVH